jgi:hypothetical protein
VLEELEEDVVAPLDVVEDGDDGPLGRDRLEQLAERPRDLVRRRGAALPEQRGERVGATGSSSSRDRCASSCFSTSTTGQ